MATILAIDPGDYSGWSYRERGVLSCCGLIRNMDQNAFPYITGTTLVIIERPKVYPRSKADPNDMISLAIKVGEFKRHYLSRGFDVDDKTHPQTWKGSVPKDIHNRRVLSWLTNHEKGVYLAGTSSVAPGLVNNVIDAIGLGKWYETKLQGCTP